MKDPSRTKQALIEENFALKQRIQELEQSEADRKCASDELRESEEKYRILLSESPDPTFSFTPEGQYRYVNRAFAEGVGKPAEDIIGQTIWDVFPKDEADKRFASLSQVFRTGNEEVIEVHVPRVDGDRYYMTTITPVKDTKGEILSVVCSSKDITERHLTEDALRESEERFRAFMDNMPSMVIIKDKELRPLFFNRKFDETFPAKEWLGKRPEETFPPEIADAMRSNDLKALLEGFVTYEEEWNDRDCCLRILETRKFAIAQKDKAPLLGVIITDNTDRRRAEEELRTSETFLETVIENSPFSLWVSDEKGILIRMNQACRDLLRVTDEELVGKYNILQDNIVERQGAMPLVKRVFERGESVRFPLRYDSAQLGSLRIENTVQLILEVTISPVLDSQGRVVHAIIQHLDVTERTQAEEALRESEEKYRSRAALLEAQLNATIDGILVIDENQKRIIINQRIIELFNVPQQILYDEDDTELLKHVVGLTKYPELFLEKVMYLYDHPNETSHDVIEFKGGMILDRYSAPVLGQDGKSYGRIWTFRDITERRQAEEEKLRLEERLNRAEKMESLGTLAGGVAHDLNNVLGIVVGYSEMLINGVDKTSPLRHRLENVLNGGLRAAAIVDDLLTLARRGVPARSILNLNKIISDCQKSPEFESLSFHHPAVKIKTNIDPDLLNISGSSVHLGKSLYNLISNASEAMAKGGILTIKTTNQYLDKPIQGYDQIQEGDYVVLSVSDTGEGIQEDDLKRIFEPFYTKKVMGRSGTGLGLAVVWGTVKDHHGYINVESKEGQGSTFTLYFPVTREDITIDAFAVPISEYMGQGETILVVDDVKEQRDLAAGMLRMLNYNVSSVSSGEEAVAYLQGYEVDLMLLDMIMDPGIDGLDTYRSILEIRPQQRAIIVSGFSESDRVRAAKDLGAGAYVRKPYIKEKLGLAVRKELDRT